MRAAKDPLHMAFLNQLRSSPENGIPKYFNILKELKVLTRQDNEREPEWMTAHIVVTSNEKR